MRVTPSFHISNLHYTSNDWIINKILKAILFSNILKQNITD